MNEEEVGDLAETVNRTLNNTLGDHGFRTLDSATYGDLK